MEIRKVDAGQGWRWIVDGFSLFRKNPLIWIVLSVIYLLITMLPLVGSLIMPVFAAGLMLACRDLENGGKLELRYLIAGFLHNTGQLLAIGALILIGQFIIMGIMGFVGGGTILGAAALNGMHGGEPPDVAIGAMGGMLAALLVMLTLLTPLLMAYWFAPALVFFNDMSAQDAMKASFAACMKNWLPFTVYGLVSFGLLFVAIFLLSLVMVMTSTSPSLVAVVPLFGLVGFLVLVPIYTGYKDVFVPDVATAE